MREHVLKEGPRNVASQNIPTGHSYKERRGKRVENVPLMVNPAVKYRKFQKDVNEHFFTASEEQFVNRLERAELQETIRRT